LSQNQEETLCKSCGRYIGAWERCPFCRHINPKRFWVRLLKYLSPVVSVVGLFVLYYVGLYYGNPEVKLETLTKRSNFAQVKINAKVSAPIKYYSSSSTKGEDAGGSMEFEIDDGTALMSVRCYDDAVRELVDSKKIPAFGDDVTVRASYQYKGKGGMLILGSEMGLEIRRKTPEKATPIKAFAAENAKFEKGDRVMVSGKVEEVRDARYELTIAINDLSGNKITAIIPLGILQAYKLIKEDTSEWQQGRPKAGDFVTIKGGIDRRGKKGSEYYVMLVPAVDEITKTDETRVKNDNI